MQLNQCSLQVKQLLLDCGDSVLKRWHAPPCCIKTLSNIHLGSTQLAVKLGRGCGALGMEVGKDHINVITKRNKVITELLIRSP
eukprot:6103555-Pyramimonas_sp.AAC.1